MAVWGSIFRLLDVNFGCLRYARSRRDEQGFIGSEKVSFTLRDIQIHVYKGLTEGTYTLRGIYKNQSGEEFGLDVWKGKVYSDEVNFQVVK